MPYVSSAQRRFFHTDTARKKGLTSETVKEFDSASKGLHLPDRVKQAYVAGVQAALNDYTKSAAAFAAPPAIPSAPKAPSLPSLPKTPKPPEPPALLAHQSNDVNTSMSAPDRRLSEGPTQPALR